MLLKDIQHLETCVGVNVRIFYLSLVMGFVGMILPQYGTDETLLAGPVCLLISMLLLI